MALPNAKVNGIFEEMKAIWSYLLSLLIVQSAAHQDVCPPWYIPDSSSSTGCSCSLGAEINCLAGSTLLQIGFCMTYNSTTKATRYGPCPYIMHLSVTSRDFLLYYRLPDNVSLLNEFMCGSLNREGSLCSRCKDGHGIALYSYTLECTKCWGRGYGWVLYYFLELFPVTVLYFLVVIFHIRATSSPLSALVFTSQVMVYTVRMNVPLHIYIENEVNGFPYVVLQVLLVLCGIWSLDFFRFVIPPFCVSNIKTVHALALEYVVAFYPIFLILVTYGCIKLHDNNFRPVVWLWKPFHRHFVHFRRKWDPKASIINAFTTFLLLSFSKILFVSFTLLHTIHVRSLLARSEYLLYYDATVECSTQEYSIFVSVAVCVLVIFILFPTVLLIVYPTRLFRMCASCCRFQRWHVLHMFAESFQGQYKDGTNGTRDFRMVSSTFLLLRILIVASFSPHNWSPLPTSDVRTALFVCSCCFYAIVRPYRLNYRNTVDILALVLLAILSLIFPTTLYYPVTVSITCCVLISTLLLGVPHMVLILFLCYKLATITGIARCVKRDLKNPFKAIRRIFQSKADREAEFNNDSLPDRMINPEVYEPMLPAAKEHSVADQPTGDETSANEETKRLTPVYTYGSIN